MPECFAVFLELEALRINRARQQHLVALGLDLDGNRVLEVGAGIGLHTAFFEERGCDVLSTDGRASNVAEMMRRYPERKAGVFDLDRPVSLLSLGCFNLVYCSGTLYRLRDPGARSRAWRKSVEGRFSSKPWCFRASTPSVIACSSQ